MNYYIMFYVTSMRKMLTSAPALTSLTIIISKISVVGETPSSSPLKSLFGEATFDSFWGSPSLSSSSSSTTCSSMFSEVSSSDTEVKCTSSAFVLWLNQENGLKKRMINNHLLAWIIKMGVHSLTNRFNNLKKKNSKLEKEETWSYIAYDIITWSHSLKRYKKFIWSRYRGTSTKYQIKATLLKCYSCTIKFME